MEKMTNKEAQKIFDDAATMSAEYNTVKYGPSETEVQIYKNISMSDMDTIVSLILGVAFDDGTYSFVKREATVAMCVIKYLTNIPMPTIELDNGEEKDDFLTAYQIVFGDNGLYDRRKASYWVINKIESYVDRALEMEKEEHSPLGRILNRLSELATELNAVVESMMNDGTLDDLNELLSSYSSLSDVKDITKN